MQFRWVALIALWTFLSGPIIGAPAGSPSRHAAPKAAHTVPAPAKAPAARN
jgi:hypothetical protein